DGRWFTLHVSVRGNRVQVRVDKQLVVDYVQADKPESGPVLKRGTVAVRGHGGSGAVLIRNLRVRPLTEGRPAAAAKPDAMDARLPRLRERGFALAAFPPRLEGGLTLDGVLARSWRAGIGAGIAADCGKGLPIADDKGALRFLKAMQGRPVFVGMHAQG